MMQTTPDVMVLVFDAYSHTNNTITWQHYTTINYLSHTSIEYTGLHFLPNYIQILLTPFTYFPREGFIFQWTILYKRCEHFEHIDTWEICAICIPNMTSISLRKSALSISIKQDTAKLSL